MDKNPLPPIIDKENLSLSTASREHFIDLQSWFLKRKQVLMWAGPRMPYPCSVEDFVAHLSHLHFVSYIMHDNEQLIGFGQCQFNKTHMHLGRLAIHPGYRKQGLSYDLIKRLIVNGSEMCKGALKSVSLYVYSENIAAYQSYCNMGFRSVDTPRGFKHVDGCEYMQMNLPSEAWG